MNGAKATDKNVNPEKPLTMREKLEIWRQENGKNKPDTANPLLSRKRPLVSYDSKQNVMKKMKVNEQNQAKSIKKIAKKPSFMKTNGNKLPVTKSKKEIKNAKDKNLLQSGKQAEKTLNKNFQKSEKVVEGSSSEIVEKIKTGDDGCKKVDSVESEKSNATGKNIEMALTTIDEEAEVDAGREVESAEVAMIAVEKDAVEDAEMPLQEHVENKTSFTEIRASGDSETQVKVKEPGCDDERVPAFSFYQTPKCCTPASRKPAAQNHASQKREHRRKTICLTPARTPNVNGRHSTNQKTPVRKSTSCMPPNSAPSSRNNASIKGSNSTKESPRNASKASTSTAIYSTPFKRLMDSLPANSVLKSAPRPSISSTRKPEKPNQAAKSHSKTIHAPSTPLKNLFSRLPPNSVLKSAPLRRSAPYRKSMPAVTAESLPRPPQNKIRNDVKDRRARRNTVHFTAEDSYSTPVCQPPFTPRGEWQNKELSIRERLDLWLAHKGNTVKKPFVVIKKTPAKKRKSVSTPNADEIGLNTTFTLESDSEQEVDEEVKKIENKIPEMNDLEKAVVEESLQQMIKRIEDPAEIDTVQEELDLIISTSPGVVRLASFWVVRARLAAAKDNVDRVICLLEQATAFDAQPQSIIRDEICKYLEQLKKDQLQNEETSLPDSNMDDTAMDEVDNASNRVPKTPRRRVTFAESQQHVVFQSSLIKFCLLECTPFRKKLKSTLGRQVLTPVRRSGRIDRFESRLPSTIRSHVQTASSPRQFAKNIEEGEVYFLPNPNVDSKWNDVWAVKDDEQLNHDISF